MRYVTLAALLSGCQATIPVPEVVKVPVPVPCVAAIPTRPATTSDSDLRAMDDYGLVLSLAADRRALLGHVDALEAVLQGCR